MDYDFYIDFNMSSETLKKHLPREIYFETEGKAVVTFVAAKRQNKKIAPEKRETIGLAFYLKDNPLRLLWITVNPKFTGKDLAHRLLLFSEDYFRNEGLSEIFTCLYGDAFVTNRGNTFLYKNDYEVIENNKRLISYEGRRIKRDKEIAALCKSINLKGKVFPLDFKDKTQREFIGKHAGDIRSDNWDYIDFTNSFVYLDGKNILGFCVSVLGEDKEIFVPDFYTLPGTKGDLAAKGLVISLLKTCITGKNLRVITREDRQISLFEKILKMPNTNVIYREYLKSLTGRKSDIDE